MEQILQGDARMVLATLPEASIDCCVTSPPYWGLRDYGIEPQIFGGLVDCVHQWGEKLLKPGGSQKQGHNSACLGRKVYTEQKNVMRGLHQGQFCECCDAWLGSLGAEPTPELYVEHLVEVFAGVWRVLKPKGTLWVNLGDSFANDGKWGGNTSGIHTQALHGNNGPGRQRRFSGRRPKELIGVPWLAAFAMQRAGWLLRQDIIWYKRNTTPESVRDRCTRAHEYIFMLTKQPHYWYDHEAIKEPAVSDHASGNGYKRPARLTYQDERGASRGSEAKWEPTPGGKRNKRTVWNVPTKAYRGAHFAVFPEALAELMIKAGCPPAGKHCDCDEIISTPTGDGSGRSDPSAVVGRAGLSRPRGEGEGVRPITRLEQRHYAQQMRSSTRRSEMQTICGSAFDHYIRTDRSGARPLPDDLLNVFLASGWLSEPGPCPCPEQDAGIVLDPFCGSGTTLAVAKRLDRNAIGIELNQEYIALAQQRITAVDTFASLEGMFV